MAQATESKMINFDVLYAATGGAKILDDAWVLDSACSLQVCPRKEFLATSKTIRVERL